MYLILQIGTPKFLVFFAELTTLTILRVGAQSVTMLGIKACEANISFYSNLCAAL